MIVARFPDRWNRIRCGAKEKKTNAQVDWLGTTAKEMEILVAKVSVVKVTANSVVVFVAESHTMPTAS